MVAVYENSKLAVFSSYVDAGRVGSDKFSPPILRRCQTYTTSFVLYIDWYIDQGKR
jgi:hypothetical protein